MIQQYPEITCPYCRIQFGNYKINEKDVEHLDIIWSSESGLVRKCKQPELVLENIESVDEFSNPVFKSEFQKKIEDLRQKFENEPNDITNENFDYESYEIAFLECMNYGNIGNDNEEYDREKMSREVLKEIWQKGTNLKDALKSFLIKVEYD